MESALDPDVADERSQRSLFSGIRVRNLTPSKSMRSPARNFMAWGGGSAASTKAPVSTTMPSTAAPVPTPTTVEKSRRGFQRLFSDGDRKAAAASVAASSQPHAIAPTDDASSIDAARHTKVFQSVTTWFKENDMVPAMVTPPTHTRHSLNQTYDSILDSIHQQDNQLTNELHELETRMPPRRHASAPSPHASNTNSFATLPFVTSDGGDGGGGAIFDALLVVGPDVTDISISHDLEAPFEPVVCHTYPPDMVFESIQHFCFPNAIALATTDEPGSSDTDSDGDSDDESNLRDTFFVFVLSGGGKDGQDVQYASCLKKWVRVPNSILLQPQGTHTAPLTYCILSKLPFIPFFHALLSHLMDVHVRELNQDPNLWTDLSTLMTPSHTSWLNHTLFDLSCIPLSKQATSQPIALFVDLPLLIERPHRRPSLSTESSALDESTILLLHWALPVLLKSLTFDVLLTTLAALLLETKLLVVCDDTELLTATVLGLVSLLSPLVWTGPLIAVLPATLLEYLEAPVPYVIGVQALPAAFEIPPDATLRLYPHSNRIDAVVALPTFPDGDALTADLLAITRRPDPANVDLIVDRVHKAIQAVVRNCSVTHAADHSFYDGVKATQLYSTFVQRQDHTKQHARGLASRHLKLEPKAPLITRKSVSTDNQGDATPPLTCSTSATTDAIFDLFHIACLGHARKSADQPQHMSPTSRIKNLAPGISALDRLRAMVNDDAASSLSSSTTLMPSIPSPTKRSSPVRKGKSPKQSRKVSSSSPKHTSPPHSIKRRGTGTKDLQRVVRHVSDAASPSVKSARITPRAKHSHRGVSGVPSTPTGSKHPLMPSTSCVASNLPAQAPKSSHPTMSFPLLPPPQSSSSTRTKLAVTPLPPSNPPSPLFRQPTTTTAIVIPPSLQAVPTASLPPDNIASAIAIVATWEDTSTRMQSAGKIQRIYRQWSFRQRSLVARSNSSPLKSIARGGHDKAEPAKRMFREGIAASKLGRHGTWGRRRLYCNDDVALLWWDKPKAGTSSSSSTTESTIALRDITSVVDGNKTNTKSVGSLLFANDVEDEGLCVTIHTTDPRRRCVVFKFDSVADRDRAKQGLELLKAQPEPLAKSVASGESEKIALMRAFQDELRVGIPIKKHGRQGKPHSKYLYCDASCTQLMWRDDNHTKPRLGGWLKRSASSVGSDSSKTTDCIIPISTIATVVMAEPSSPLRNFLGTTSEKRISIVSSARTLVISTESTQDHLRVFHGLKLLVRYFEAPVESDSLHDEA
ncbi:Aste57867_13490 [Aphanomyces stellatus]|uniref:Aste57867_13490 protein n=1 Tax=Aphanomyces stellatus TaxID=120398 RepID=A0A485KYS9_9STRA|nr:hypothetical protein As57867_013440 [Aphanomyces stellatus]VFT90328.1 Aste57867_13490 [Aphanomyces stellatus]